MAKLIMAIKEEDNSITNLSKTLGIPKHEVVILGLNLVNHILEQRKNGKHLVFTTTEDKTVNILTEATAGNLKFKINE